MQNELKLEPGRERKKERLKDGWMDGRMNGWTGWSGWSGWNGWSRSRSTNNLYPSLPVITSIKPPLPPPPIRPGSNVRPGRTFNPRRMFGVIWHGMVCLCGEWFVVCSVCCVVRLMFLVFGFVCKDGDGLLSVGTVPYQVLVLTTRFNVQA